PPAFRDGMADDLEELVGEIPKVADAAGRIVHGERIDGLDLRAAEAGVTHERELARDLVPGDGSSEPPPARHGTSGFGRPAEELLELGPVWGRRALGPARGGSRKAGAQEERGRARAGQETAAGERAGHGHLRDTTLPAA